MEEHKSSAYWFPAKKYGFGGGFPTRWQGWVTVVIFVLAVITTSIYFNPVHHPYLFAFGLAACVIILTFICLLKGEPPKWR